MSDCAYDNLPLTQKEADGVIKQAKEGGCCPSCHDDHDYGSAPWDECHHRLNNGTILKACCCDVLRMAEKILQGEPR